jgi:hypothetical protein
MSSLVKDVITSEPFLAFLYRFIRAYSATFRYSIENEEPWMDYLNGAGACSCAAGTSSSSPPYGISRPCRRTGRPS